jgi:hypothetical protein
VQTTCQAHRTEAAGAAVPIRDKRIARGSRRRESATCRRIHRRARRVDEAGRAEPRRRTKGVVVYRLSVRNTSRCKACARHHRRFAFLTHAIADAHRAHRGCNCPITTQAIRPRTFRMLFPKGGVGVGDLAAPAAARTR